MQSAIDIIVVISGVIVAITTIYNFVRKPVDKISKYALEREEQHIEEITSTILVDVKTEIIKALETKFAVLQEINQAQNEKIDGISDTLEKVLNSSKDVLRIRMNEIYYKYLPYRKICNSDKQLFDNLYKDYAELHGNGTWQKMDDTLQTWMVVSDDYNFEQDI